MNLAYLFRCRVESGADGPHRLVGNFDVVYNTFR